MGISRHARLIGVMGFFEIGGVSEYHGLSCLWRSNQINTMNIHESSRFYIHSYTVHICLVIPNWIFPVFSSFTSHDFLNMFYPFFAPARYLGNYPPTDSWSTKHRSKWVLRVAFRSASVGNWTSEPPQHPRHPSAPSSSASLGQLPLNTSHRKTQGKRKSNYTILSVLRVVDAVPGTLLYDSYLQNSTN